ncbi:vacuolar protein sorting vps16 [Anaeramoeba ignava]|uniref:Vacuolar protein sorting vps16 n=1 Tax=Anaeramoeba ignava TaxID=1746090 RepID=A0A9Q0LKP9_ANAIG|nr:vacuolar protein sorting vps16 [Anaeramoeba ignava]|eukprot:Anaeramoba_ignava/a217376_74.p1 GENE.a217376_74~~a217376_74.p1  ORF type:complete len:909 (+),score=166.13 a217376_74:3-2729(+)
MSLISTEWTILSNHFYRQQELYKLDWDVKLEDYILSGGQYGGALALARDETQFVKAQTSMLKSKVFIYTSAGKLIGQIDWMEKSRILSMGWTDNGRLAIATEDGAVDFYSVLGKHVWTFNLPKAFMEEGILFVDLLSNGLIAMTKTFRLFATNEFGELTTPLFNEYKMPKIRQGPKCRMGIEAKFANSRNVEVWLGLSDGNIAVIDSNGYEERDVGMTEREHVVKMALSSNGKMVCLVSNKGRFVVYTSDLGNFYLDFQSHATRAPTQMLWCSSDSILSYWQNVDLLLMIGPTGESVQFDYDGKIYLVPEPDGARVVSATKCDFISVVPSPLTDIFKIGSASDASILFDAIQNFETKSAKVDEIIRSISQRGKLSEAIKMCIKAAAHEFRPDLQRKLLRTACFAKSYLDFFDHDSYADKCKIIRVLNNIRTYTIGIPITYPQYKLLGIEGLIERLLDHNQHLLAFSICKSLKMNTDQVLLRWAAEKIRTNEQKDKILQAILDKIGMESSISYSRIAAVALSEGKESLAMELLNYEFKVAHQVPLFLRMNNIDFALQKAIQSGQTDFIYLVIFHLIDSRRPINESLMYISKFPLSRNLLVAYWKSSYAFHDKLKILYQISRLDHEASLLCVLESSKHFLIQECRISAQNENSAENPENIDNSLAIGNMKTRPRHTSDLSTQISNNLLDSKNDPREDIKKNSLDLNGFIEDQNDPSEFNYSTNETFFQKKLQTLRIAALSFQQSHDSFMTKMVQDNIDILQLQKKYESDYRGQFIGLTITQTIDKVVTNKDLKEAEKLYKKFVVPQKKFWWIVIRALARARHFSLLLEFSKKKSPIGYEPFVQVCVQNFAPQEAEQFVDKISDLYLRGRYFARLGRFEKAREIAAQSKNQELSEFISELESKSQGNDGDW